MSLQGRMRLLLATLVVLLAVQAGVHLWTRHRRAQEDAQLARLEEALASVARLQGILTRMASELETLAEAPTPRISPADRQRFQRNVDTGLAQLRRLGRAGIEAPEAEEEELRREFLTLTEAWRAVYRSPSAEALAALDETATPTLRILQLDRLPQVLAAARQRLGEARADRERVERQLDLAGIGVGLIAAFLIVLIGFFLLRHLARGLLELRRGASAIGGGDLHHRIALEGHDEFAELAGNFNDMSHNMQLAQRQLTMANRELEERNREIDEQRRLSETLLRNILPGEVAAELSSKGKVEPRYFEDVSILFSDFVGFTSSTEHMAAEELVSLLHDYFTDFDRIARRYNLEKLKTIGDSYMCVGGLPVRRPSHPVDVVLAAFEMIEAVRARATGAQGPDWSVRIGIHTGAVISGVVGIDKFAFDVWGETVNFSSRVESTGQPDRINISAATYARVKDFFDCEPRGRIRTKENREYEMYFVRGIHPRLLDGDGEGVPESFAHRYRVYFEAEPPDFPAFLRDGQSP